MQHSEFLQNRREWSVEFLKVLERKDLAGNLAENRCNTVLLVKKIGPETRDVWNFVAEIHVAGFFERFYFVLGRDLIEHFFEIVIAERRMVHTMEFAIDAQHGVIARGKV